MPVSVQESAPGTLELEVLVDEEQYGKVAREVLDQIAQNTAIPGFRKGKAPRSIVERSINPEAVRTRVIEKVLPTAYKDAMEEVSVTPLEEPRVEILESEGNRDLRFRVIIQKQPEVEVGQFRGLDLVQYITSISDEDVEREVRNALESRPIYDPEPDSPIELGDIAVIDVEVLEDGEPIDEATTSQMEIRVGAYEKTPAVDDDLVGLKTGDVADIEISYPPDFQVPRLRGLNVVWHVTIGEVRRRRLAELSDDFVKEIAGVESVEEFRLQLRQKLEERARELDEGSLEVQAIRKVMENSTVVFPHILVDQEVDSRRQRMERTLQRSRMSVGQFAASQGISVAELVRQMHDQAEEDLRQYLLIHRIAAQEGIEVSAEEIDAQIEEEGNARGARSAIIEIEKQNETRRTGVAFDLLKERVLDLILKDAHITEEHQSFDEATSGDSAGAGLEIE